jgi:integrase
MKAAICESDPQLWLFICFIYFIFIRPGEELRRLRVRDIRQKTIVVMGEAAKNSQTEHIMIPAALEAIIVENNLRDLPEDYYIFSKNRRPGTHLLGKNNFYKRHLIFLKSMKFDQPHDLYGYKHTGVISLFLATQNIELIRKQCRHADIATTEKYLRDLGLFINYDEINKFPAI